MNHSPLSEQFSVLADDLAAAAVQLREGILPDLTALALKLSALETAFNAEAAGVDPAARSLNELSRIRAIRARIASALVKLEKVEHRDSAGSPQLARIRESMEKVRRYLDSSDPTVAEHA